MATIIVFVSLSSMERNELQNQKICRQLIALLLDGAHDIDDAFVDVDDLCVRKRSRIGAANVLEDILFPLGLVDGKAALLLKLADGLCGFRAVIDKANDLLIELVD